MLLTAFVSTPMVPADDGPPAETLGAQVASLFETHCVRCHNTTQARGGLSDEELELLKSICERIRTNLHVGRPDGARDEGL